MVRIEDLALFVDLVEAGSFSAIGRETGQAPSSIARRLDRLEVAVGARLVNRTPTGLFVTATGTRKLAEARALVEAARSFSEPDAASGPLAGSVTLAAPSRLGQACVVPIVADFLARHPHVTIDLHLTDALQDLDRDRIDLAVRIGRDAPGHHRVRRIAENRRILVAAPGFLAGRAPIEKPEALAEVDAVVLGTAPVWDIVSRDGRRMRAEPRIRARSIGGDAVTDLCEAGLGVALKSAWDVRAALEAGRLVRVLPEWWQADGADVVVVTPSRRLVPRVTTALAQALESGLKPLLEASFERD